MLLLVDSQTWQGLEALEAGSGTLKAIANIRQVCKRLLWRVLMECLMKVCWQRNQVMMFAKSEDLACRPYRSRTCDTLIKRYKRFIPERE